MPHTSSLHTIADLQPGDHLCCLYETDEEHQALLAPFLRQGLDRGERVIYIVDARTAETVLGYLGDGGLDVEACLAREQLLIFTSDRSYLRGGIFDPDDMIEWLRTETERAVAQGYTALRVTGEMSWALRGLSGSERLIEYEAKLNELLPGSACIELCQYDRRRFDPAILLDVLRTHPIAVVGVKIYDNFYYGLPAEFLGRDLSAVTLHHWVNNLAERKRAEEELEQRAAQLALLSDIGGKIAAVLELDSVLERAARLVQESFGYHHVALFLLDREAGELVMRARTGDFAHLFPLDHRLRLEQGMVGWVGSHGKRLLANDVAAEPHYINLYPDVIPTRSELSVPIQVGEEIVGVLDIQSPQLDAFDENDVMVMETLADQIAVACENARLYEAVQQELAERVWAEERLRESEARYRTVSELTSDFAYAFRVESDGTLVPEWVTEAFTRITGFTPEERLAHGGWESLTHPQDRYIAFQHMQVHLCGQPDVAEFRIITQSGEVRWLRDYGRPVWDEAQSRVVRIYGAAQDITERKRMEQFMLRTERLAAMGHMAAALAHEIKNPLQAIQGHVELVSDFDLEPDERKEYLRFCSQEIKHLTEIADRVLGFARPAEDSHSLISIHQLAQRALALVSKPLQDACVAVTVDLPADLPPVLVVPDQIVQVFLNLMINAIEAMANGGHLHLAVHVEGEMMVLTLTNDGPPIPSEHIEQVFDPFFTTKPEGTGLGLFISHTIVEQHGGTISVENLKDNQGVCFTITLPIAPLGEEQEAIE